MEIIDKFVEFDKYCKNCKYEKNKESEEPCDECLANTTNVNSHKPVYFQEKEKEEKKKVTNKEPVIVEKDKEEGKE